MDNMMIKIPAIYLIIIFLPLWSHYKHRPMRAVGDKNFIA